MAKSSNQKLKLLYIVKFLMQNSDEEHPVSTAQIIEELKKTIFPQREKAFMMTLILSGFSALISFR